MKELFPTALPAGLSSTAFTSFLIFALTSSASLGPNNLLIMSVAARSGLRRTLPCILAITLSFGSMLLLGAMGGAAILHHACGPVRILGILGGCWMLYLAWTIARTRPDNVPAGLLPHWGKAFVLCWSNLKAWMMALTTGTTYLPQGPRWFLALSALIGIKLAIGLLSQLGWAALGLYLYRLGDKPEHIIRINLIMGGLLAASAIAILV